MGYKGRFLYILFDFIYKDKTMQKKLILMPTARRKFLREKQERKKREEKKNKKNSNRAKRESGREER